MVVLGIIFTILFAVAAFVTVTYFVEMSFLPSAVTDIIDKIPAPVEKLPWLIAGAAALVLLVLAIIFYALAGKKKKAKEPELPENPILRAIVVAKNGAINIFNTAKEKTLGVVDTVKGKAIGAKDKGVEIYQEHKIPVIAGAAATGVLSIAGIIAIAKAKKAKKNEKKAK